MFAPGQQNKPAAWRTHTFEQLMSDVYWHTYDTMNALATNNVFPEWAQVGNETNNGMLWEDGRASVNMRDMRSRYGKDVMLVEAGMSWDQATTSRSFLTDIISKTRSAGGLGVLYWEPQAYNWVGYTKGAWDADGRPTVALDAFLEATPQPGAVTIQENSTGFCGVDGTIDNNNSGYSGTGFANTNNVAGASVRWRVNAATSGTYTLRCASACN